jgi:drug/metabolite transporter (DMT)-like permease
MSDPETTVIAIVLCAAVLHALWNAMVKISDDKIITMSVMDLAVLPIAAILVLFLPFPHPDSWVFLATSIFVHIFYRIFLVKAYAYGDLSSAYPLARGGSPLLVAILAFTFEGERLEPMAYAGIALISCGLLSLLIGKQRPDKNSIIYAGLTACMIAIYSFADAQGSRTSGNVIAYIAWLFFLDSIPMPLYYFVTNHNRMIKSMSTTGLRDAAAGIISFMAYAFVIWSFTFGATSQISALRETSVIFAALIGTFFLKESFGLKRIIAAIIVAAGVILMRL